jgi:hypothetical protein
LYENIDILQHIEFTIASAEKLFLNIKVAVDLLKTKNLSIKAIYNYKNIKYY